MTFYTQYNHFEYQVMLFGLSNTPASFQGYINKILAEKLNIFVIIYLDATFIYIKYPVQSYVAAIWWVLDLLRKYGFFVNFKKGHFYKDEVCFLSYIIFAQGIRMENKRIEEIRNWFEPKLVRDIQVFFAFANFYCYFVQCFNEIAVPLN